MSPLIIVLIVLAVLFMWVIALYNGLVKLKNRVKEAWSDIDVQLKRRHDLIPNLIESVKGYMKHEQGLLENITKARAGAMEAQSSGNTAELAKQEGVLGNLLGGLRVAMEAYPDLKANQNMAQLMDELSDTENKIQSSRRFYNGMVKDFNTKVETFPNNIIVGMFNFEKYNFFQIENEAEKQNVQVKF